MDFSTYRAQLLRQRERELALWELVRNFSRWFFDLLRNFVLVGGLKYFYEKIRQRGSVFGCTNSRWS